MSGLLLRYFGIMENVLAINQVLVYAGSSGKACWKSMRPMDVLIMQVLGNPCNVFCCCCCCCFFPHLPLIEGHMWTTLGGCYFMLENKLDIYRNSYTFMFSLQMQHAAVSGPSCHSTKKRLNVAFPL